MTSEQLLQAGLTAAKTGDRIKAVALFAQLVQTDPQSEQGWWYLGLCVADPKQQAFCFQRVLALNPNHTEAQQRLAALTAPPPPLTVASPVAAPPPFIAATIASPVAAPPQPALKLVVAEAAPLTSPAPIAPAPAPKPSPAFPKGLVMGALGLIAGCIICGAPLVVLMMSGALDRFLPAQASALSATATISAATESALVSAPTQSGPPTFPPTWTPPASPTPRPTGTPTSASSFQSRFDAAQPEIAQAFGLMLTADYAEAVTAWNNVLLDLPEYAYGYYQRAEAYLSLTDNQRFQDEYLDYLNHGLNDLSQAIALDPSNGNYHHRLGTVYESLASSAFYRVDQDYGYTLALDQYVLANQLGTTVEFADRYPAFVLAYTGRCDEALAEANRLVDGLTQPSGGPYTARSHAYTCLDQSESALADIDTALSINPIFDRQFQRAIILYNLGQLDDALEQIDATIAESPYYCGCRYYVRALIYYEMGRPDDARADIEFGTGQTWDRGGPRSYVLAQLALDSGDQQTGIELLQEAEASLPRRYGPALLEKMRDQLADLGAAPLSLTASVWPNPTPLPVTPVAQPPTATPATRLPAEADAAILVDYLQEIGTGPLTIQPGDSYVFHFQPSSSLSYAELENLVIEFDSTSAPDLSGVELYLWNFADGFWEPFTARLGSGTIPNPQWYLSDSDEAYIALVGAGGQATALDNMRLMLAVVDETGSPVVYGANP